MGWRFWVADLPSNFLNGLLDEFELPARDFSFLDTNAEVATAAPIFTINTSPFSGLQTVLVAVLHVALAGVDHEYALTADRTFLVQHQDAGGDAGAVEQIGGQADDALDEALSAKLPPPGTSISALGSPAYLSETYLTKSRTST
jgi:hypothetical protein